MNSFLAQIKKSFTTTTGHYDELSDEDKIAALEDQDSTIVRLTVALVVAVVVGIVLYYG